MRFTVRRLMALVAMAASAMAVVTLGKRSMDFRALAVERRFNEIMSKLYADEGRGTTGDEQRVARGEQMATYHRGLKIKYERASWIPGSPFIQTRRYRSRRSKRSAGWLGWIFRSLPAER